FQPLQHWAAGGYGALKRFMSIQRYEVNIAPVKRIVLVAVTGRYVLRWQCMNRHIGSGSRTIIVIADRRKEWNGTHRLVVIVKIVPLIKIDVCPRRTSRVVNKIARVNDQRGLFRQDFLSNRVLLR